ncbi:hypothetical protein ACLB2K_004629 [Fragaria x ananassa]
MSLRKVLRLYRASKKGVDDEPRVKSLEINVFVYFPLCNTRSRLGNGVRCAKPANVRTGANTAYHKPRTARIPLVKWYPPDADFIKINFDASVQHNRVAIGFVFWDSDGNPITVATRFIWDAPVLLAETTALKEVLHAAWLQQFSHVLIEGYSKACYFRHVHREANFVADQLASLGLTASSLLEWFYYLPLSVSPVFHLDQLGDGLPGDFEL